MVFSVLWASENLARKAGPLVPEWLVLFLCLSAINFFFYWTKNKKQQAHDNLIKGLVSGDRVVTAGGLLGAVKQVAEDHIVLDLGSTHVKILKAHVLEKRS